MADALPIQPEVIEGVPAPASPITYDARVVSMSRDSLGFGGVFIWVIAESEEGFTRRYKIEIARPDFSASAGLALFEPFPEVSDWAREQGWDEAYRALIRRWLNDVDVYQERQQHFRNIRNYVAIQTQGDIASNTYFNSFMDQSGDYFDEFAAQAGEIATNAINHINQKLDNLSETVSSGAKKALVIGGITTALGIGANWLIKRRNKNKGS